MKQLQKNDFLFVDVEQEDKMLESINYILQSIDISSFKAEFNLETNQVKVELLAEFEDFPYKLKRHESRTALNKDSNNEVISGDRSSTMDDEQGTEKDKEKVIKSIIEDKKDYYPSIITKKKDRFLTSGISPGEKKKFNSYQDIAKT